MKITIQEEFKNLISPLTDKAFMQPKQNIIKNGCRTHLILWKDIYSIHTVGVNCRK